MSCSLIFLLCLQLFDRCCVNQPTWKAGFGAVKITPNKYMWMAGYASRTAPADGKETELWAKAMVLQSSSGEKLVLITLDLIGIDRQFSQKVCKLVMEKHRVQRESLVLSVSHTHCGPVVGSTLNTMYFYDQDQAKLIEDYTNSLPLLISQAVDQGFKNLEPAIVKSGLGTASFAVNRRENKEDDVPALRAKGQLKGPVDHDVPVLVVQNLKGQVKGIVFGYACHATVMAYQKWSGDYPGFATLELEKLYPGSVAMFWAGCGGDQNPLPRRSVEYAKAYGQQLAQAVDAVLSKPMETISPDCGMIYREIALSLAEIPSREALVKETQSTDRYIATRAKLLLNKLQHGEKLPDSYPYPVQTWRLGKDLTWVMLGGEVVVDYSKLLKKQHDGKLWVMAYANDVMAYIPSTRILKEGGYEGTTAMIYYGLPGVWGKEIQGQIVDEVTLQIERIRKK